MEFQFGTNWAYYSHYVGDIFGAPLAIEGLMAFFLESTFIGLFFFGWDRCRASAAPAGHLLMAHRHQPVGAVDPDRQRLDAEPGGRRVQLRHHAHGDDRLLGGGVQPGRAGQVRAHRVGRLRHRRHVRAVDLVLVPAAGRDVEFAKRSFRIAAAFGLASAPVGDRAGRRIGYTVGEAQQTKLAAIEAMWETEPAPAGFNLIAWPNEAEQKNDWAIEIPWVMGLIGTRSISKQIPGINEIKEKNRERIVPASRPVKRPGAACARPRTTSRQAQRSSAQGGPGLRPAAEEIHADVRQARRR
jgi:cytochrome d ubiquinol oxidase subunit I